MVGANIGRIVGEIPMPSFIVRAQAIFQREPGLDSCTSLSNQMILYHLGIIKDLDSATFHEIKVLSNNFPWPAGTSRDLRRSHSPSRLEITFSLRSRVILRKGRLVASLILKSAFRIQHFPEFVSYKLYFAAEFSVLLNVANYWAILCIVCYTVTQ